LIRRRWSTSLAKVLDPEDYEQQAWVYFLALEPPPKSLPEATRDVWITGRLMGRLHAWCRGIYRRIRREAELATEPESLRAGGFLWIDALETAESICTEDELVCVYFRAAGYRNDQVQEILGITSDAFRKRLQRLQDRVADGQAN
jgi:hypothetical protein